MKVSRFKSNALGERTRYEPAVRYMIGFGRMGLNREGKTATQGCETKRGAHRKGPYTHFLARHRGNLDGTGGSEPRKHASGRPESLDRQFESRSPDELFFLRRVL
jgi:hypothetical protein